MCTPLENGEGESVRELTLRVCGSKFEGFYQLLGRCWAGLQQCKKPGGSSSRGEVPTLAIS